MTYRDETESLRQRVATLEADLERASKLTREAIASKAVSDRELAESTRALTKAHDEIARLRAELPASLERTRRPFLVLIGSGVAAFVAALVAGAQTEKAGVAATYVGVLLFGAGVGGTLGAKARSPVLRLLAAGVGALLAGLLLAVFYSSIWPSL